MKWQRNQSRTPVWLGLAILLLLALLAACTGQPDPPAAERNGLSPDDITETDWALVALGHPDDLQPAREGWSYPTLTFDAELARGTTGCNDYAADYTRDGMALIFGEVEQTAQDCPTAAALEQENRFTALLADVRHFSLTDDRLMLAASDGVLLFEADTSDAEQVTATVTPAAEQPTPTAPPTAAMTAATATATPLPTPGASITPAPSSQTYRWPAALPEPLAIVPGESYADPTGFVLTLTDATGGQLRAQIGGGAHAQFTGDPRPGAQPVTIRGQAGYEFTTGAGWSLYWVEDGTSYSIISGLPREMAFAVADGLEPVDLTTWQQRLATVSTPTITPAVGLTYFWPGWLPEGWVIRPASSFADSTGFVLDIAHSDEPLTFATISGGSTDFTAAISPDAALETLTIRGQAAMLFPSGGGGPRYVWREDGHWYAVTGMVTREMLYNLTSGFEEIDLPTWQQRLSGIEPGVAPTAAPEASQPDLPMTARASTAAWERVTWQGLTHSMVMIKIRSSS